MDNNNIDSRNIDGRLNQLVADVQLILYILKGNGTKGLVARTEEQEKRIDILENCYSNAKGQVQGVKAGGKVLGYIITAIISFASCISGVVATLKVLGKL